MRDRETLIDPQGMELVYSGVIWSNGLDRALDILEQVDGHPGVRGIGTCFETFPTTGEMVKEIYREDTVPQKHLVAKAQYLERYAAECLHFFFTIGSASTVIVGENEWAHQETPEVNELKWSIRERFNPRTVNGEMSHDHVIHFSDTRIQSRKALEGLTSRGHKPIDSFTRKRLGIWFPNHVPAARSGHLRSIELNSLFVGVIEGDGTKEVELQRGPIYAALNSDDKERYNRYIKPHIGKKLRDWYSWGKVKRMEASYLSGSAFSPVIVSRREERGFVVLDGAHRASIAAKHDRQSISALVI